MYPEGTSMVCTRYDFVGNILEVLETQNVNSITNSIRVSNTMDVTGRLTDSYLYLNNAVPVLLYSLDYNELGEVETKKLHSTNYTDYLQDVDFTYNIRGWLSAINDPESLESDGDLFAMNLYYDDLDPDIGSTKRYNGNVSGMSWIRDETTDTLRAYVFNYDEISRLVSSDFKYKTISNWVNPTWYGTAYSYDDNGNLSTLSRKNHNGTLIDSLSYDYTSTGNMLNYIVENGTSAGVGIGNTSGADYLYDGNGNMYWDKNKDIKIDYNYLNLPEKIYEESGSGDELSYIYDASGFKWLKVLETGSSLTKTMYAGNFVYLDSDGDTGHDFTLEYILHSEGKALKNGSSFNFEYNLKDHLGNTRVVFNETGNEVQSADYYPFGLAFHFADNGSDNKYLYNGKEMQDDMLG